MVFAAVMITPGHKICLEKEKEGQEGWEQGKHCCFAEVAIVSQFSVHYLCLQ